MTRDELVGAWRLREFRLTDADGAVSHPWLEGSTGLLYYTADGYMAALTHVIDEPGGAGRFMSYGGPYELMEDRLVHHVAMSSDAALVGTDQTRMVAYDGETLTLSSSPSLYAGPGSTSALVWERA